MNHPISIAKSDTTLMSRRRCLGILAASTLPAVALPGCALVNTESPYWATVAAVGGLGGRSPVTRAQADALPYASILAWYEDSPQSFMVLGEIARDGTFYYHSQTRQILALQGPFLVQTVGVPGDLSRTRWPGEPVTDIRPLAGQSMLRFLEIQSASLFDVEVRSQFVKEDTETIIILDRSITLDRYREDVTMRGEKSYSNLYWIDSATGRCWKSKQRAHARLDMLNIEVTKPAG